MIVGARAAQRPDFRGFNVLALPDWTGTPEPLAHSCFGAFDESLLRMRSDPDATRIAVAGATTVGPLTSVHTASETALRSLPERQSDGCRFHSLVVVAEAGGLVAWTDLPAWALLQAESVDGRLENLDRGVVDGSWSKIALKPDDLRLHLCLFRAGANLSRACFQDTRFFRASELIRADVCRARFSLLLREEFLESLP
jgi:hypothetical protein